MEFFYRSPSSNAKKDWIYSKRHKSRISYFRLLLLLQLPRLTDKNSVAFFASRKFLQINLFLQIKNLIFFIKRFTMFFLCSFVFEIGENCGYKIIAVFPLETLSIPLILFKILKIRNKAHTREFQCMKFDSFNKSIWWANAMLFAIGFC